jgi:hypothetical protein
LNLLKNGYDNLFSRSGLTSRLTFFAWVSCFFAGCLVSQIAHALSVSSKLPRHTLRLERHN